MLDQPSAEHGPDSCSDRAKTRPGSNRATAFVLRKRAADNGETARDKKRRAQSLKCAGGNQLMNVRDKSASRRRQGEDGHTDQKNVSASVAVAERTTDEEERGEQEGISFDHPLHVHRGGVEICLQCRQRNVYDGTVDERHARSQNGGGKDPAAP